MYDRLMVVMTIIELPGVASVKWIHLFFVSLFACISIVYFVSIERTNKPFPMRFAHLVADHWVG